ncbi:MAG: MarP family serine protease [Micrococcales bacterium]|nr:MarP family serine protease [Micrococcales bacterium]
MLAARLLDVLIVLILLVYVVVGYREGFLRTVGGLIGIAVGGVAVFFGIPLLVPLISEPFWRVVATIVVTVLLLALGHSVGYAVGRSVRRRFRARPLAIVDRIVGAITGLVVSALICSLVLGGLGALGAPLVSAAAGQSWVAGGITQLTPAPVQAGLARLRALALENGLPRITEALGGVATSPGAPRVDTASAALRAAAASVVRINGTAYACGQNQSGSGFAVAPDRIVTNAHVVAGVDQPVVEAPNGQAVQARVVYFDPDADLAVLATTGLDVSALGLSRPMAVGDDGVVDGYPYGGPFTSGGARVLARSTELVDDIYGTGRNPREVYALAATVRPGNSGGPLLTPAGQVAGVVFAQNANDDELGYAMSTESLAPVVAQAASRSAAVDPGRCTRG